MKRMQEKVCLVTGAASGIGLACAQRLAEEGAHVLLTDRDAAKGEQVTAALAAAGLSVSFQRHDVVSRTEWESVIDAAVATYGQLDVLVNNAGVALLADIEHCELADWKRTLDVNLDGVFHGVQLAVRAMKAKGGSIVNLSSIEGILGEPHAAAYNASKGAVRLLTKSAAVYCGRSGYRVRVNAVCPGFIETPMVAQAFASLPADQAQALQAKTFSRVPMGRLGQPVEIANAVLFLASDEASFVTGIDMLVDGGYTAG
ncbi:glucose 1-dehydrogenase [Pseudomonas jessenii]|uniref:glucose 1-dehydrogenase n=1 Tax=Pseudomonas jessenii TaxID=77298 RepID=UPI0038929521